MIPLVLNLGAIDPDHRHLVGGKAYALALMVQAGLKVPPAVCVTTEGYRRFINTTGLKGRIILELSRKRFGDMRWEEIWDASLRIRQLFLKAPLPDNLVLDLKKHLKPFLGGQSVVVRSSAPGEDSVQASFAGLHESFVNITGLPQILEHIKLVWASLWSDRALLYRKELGLEVAGSSMAVVVQKIVYGDKSGVVFSQNPQDRTQTVMEAVYGLNQGLVDGAVEPDRWILDRGTGRLVSFRAAPKEKVMRPTPEGTRLIPLTAGLKRKPVLDPGEVSIVFKMALNTESHFGRPQDMEWTFGEDGLFLLQTRPITTAASMAEGDERPWYLSLRRSFDNLKGLRKKVEQKLIPALKDEGNRLARQDLAGFSDDELRDELVRRALLYRHWKKVYWEEFIPLAHGIRLFGAVYNQTVKPTNPFEFMDLLGDTNMVSLARNRRLEDLAARIRDKASLKEQIKANRLVDGSFRQGLDRFLEEFGDLFCNAGTCSHGREDLLKLLIEMAGQPAAVRTARATPTTTLTKRYLSAFPKGQQEYGKELLELGRASYRLRDDDNIYLGRIMAQTSRAYEAFQARRRAGKPEKGLDRLPRDVLNVIQEIRKANSAPKKAARSSAGFKLKARQLLGQPAGPGLVTGRARVILKPGELFEFKAGEILVCDAVDPTMTFVVPLAAGIVERRGGMLIHGSIIAREYGLACVTGVPGATELIQTGDRVTVDGFLGIVILGEDSLIAGSH